MLLTSQQQPMPAAAGQLNKKPSTEAGAFCRLARVWPDDHFYFFHGSTKYGRIFQ
jgi:hypothetical protein